MRIGIDIDGTLTDIQDELIKAANIFAKLLNKNVENTNEEIIDKTNDGNIYKKVFKFDDLELKYFLGPLQESITERAIPRKDCASLIKKLHDEKNEIYIITARDYKFHKNPYKQSLEWLNKNNIQFDKLIVNAIDKGKICQEEKIDILIDDNINNCKNAVTHGSNAILITNDNLEFKENIKCFNNWLEIYNHIQEN